MTVQSRWTTTPDCGSMKCLSLKQPFAELLISGRKTVELRTWNTKYRGSFLVHASGNTDKDACKLFNMDAGSLIRHAVVGKATLVGVKEYKSTSEFAQDRSKHLAPDKYISSKYGFILKDAVRFKTPIRMPGRLGFFEVAWENQNGPAEI